MTRKVATIHSASPDHRKGEASRVRVYGWVKNPKTETFFEHTMEPWRAVRLAESILTAARQAQDANERDGLDG